MVVFRKLVTFFQFLVSSSRNLFRFYGKFRDRVLFSLDFYFSNYFQGYTSFSSFYKVVKPYLLIYFLVLFFIPCFFISLYLFFVFWRFLDSFPYRNFDFFIYVYGIRIESFINLLYAINRYAESSGFYYGNLGMTIHTNVFFTLFTHPKWFTLLTWQFSGVSLTEISDYFSRLVDHVRATPIPSRPHLPALESFIFNYIYADPRFYWPNLENAMILKNWWWEFFRTTCIAIFNIPVYIWVDRTDLLFWEEHKFTMKHQLFRPAWDYFKAMYIYEVTGYIRDWLAFIPNFGVTTSIPYYFATLVFNIFSSILVTVFSVRSFLIVVAQVTDPISLYYDPFLAFIYSVVSIVYGFPFLLFSGIFLYLVLFFTTLRIFVVESLLGLLDKIYASVWPFFTTIEDLFSDNIHVRDDAYAKFFWELSDLWMIFIPLNYFLVVVYLALLFLSFAWFVLYRPLFLLYCLFYDFTTGSRRPASEVKDILYDQFSLFKLIIQFKWYLSVLYFFTTLHIVWKVIEVNAREVGRYFFNWIPGVYISRDYSFIGLPSLFEETRELTEKFIRDLVEYEAMMVKIEDGQVSWEEEIAFFEEEERKIEAANEAQRDLFGWSTWGTRPEAHIMFSTHVSCYVRRVFRFFATPWGLLGIIGLFGGREVYVRLFMDGVSPNAVNPLLAVDDAQYHESDAVVKLGKMDTWLHYERYKMRWLPEYGAQPFYEPTELTPVYHSYADLIVSAFCWFYIGFCFFVTIVGFTWLVYRTFRELVNAYWVAATFAFLYSAVGVFGEAYSHSLLDYALPFMGFLDSWSIFLDGWGVGVGLTDLYDELRLIMFERQLRANRFTQWLNEKPALGWWRYRGMIIYATYYYRNKFIAYWFARKHDISGDKIDSFQNFWIQLKYYEPAFVSRLKVLSISLNDWFKFKYDRIAVRGGHTQKVDHFPGNKDRIKEKDKDSGGDGGSDDAGD